MDTTYNEDVDIYFVVDDVNQNSVIMRKAFSMFQKQKYSVKWILAEAIDEFPIEGVQLFVLENFNNKAYDLLRSHDVRIISPYVVLYCDADSTPEPFDFIPQRKFPILSQCMRRLYVTATNLSQVVKKEVEERVSQMSGFYSTCLTRETNFLISDSVLTPKYHAANQLKIPVLKQEWITKCWDNFQFQFRRANEPDIIEQFRLPIFFDSTKRENHISELIRSNGGQFSPSLLFDVPNMILLAKEKLGDKYYYACKKNIPRLQIKWLYDSIEQKYALSLEKYSLENVETSNNDVQHLDEVNVCNEKEEKQIKIPNNEHLLADILDELFATYVKQNDIFLDKCVIFVDGFDYETTLSIRNVSRRCGALFVSEFKPMVTHIIIGTKFTSKDSFLKLSKNVPKVTIDWLIESVKSKHCQNVELYTYVDEDKKKDDNNDFVNEFENVLLESPPPYPPTKRLFDPVIVFSGFEQKEKESLCEQVFENLNGQVYDDRYLTNDVTHLIINELRASEKLLSAMALGIWIMKPEYVKDSIKAGRWLPELQYQWGKEDDNQVLPIKELNRTLEQQLISSSISWRQNRERTGLLAFHDWNILILNNSKLIQIVTKIFQLGGGRLYYMDDYIGSRELDLKEIMEKVRYAIIDLGYKKEPAHGKKRFFELREKTKKRML
ncbi:DNA topoisomerase 2-binding protein 1 [Blomia tropicalis]|nr:DNA topoisomerase 2-binding protein 1 [Blomia tropicalis]